MSKKETLEKFFKFMEKWHYEDFNAFENHFNKLMSMKSKEQLTNENDALKDSIAVILAQKKNVHKHCDEKDQQIDQLKQQLAEKDIRIEELEGQFAYECECNKQLVKLQKKLDQANERLKGAGVTKFELGQEVFVFDWEEQIRSGRIYEIQINAVLHDRQPHITYLVDFTGNYNDDDQENDYYEEKDIYATEEEINIKLQELRG